MILRGVGIDPRFTVVRARSPWIILVFLPIILVLVIVFGSLAGLVLLAWMIGSTLRQAFFPQRPRAEQEAQVRVETPEPAERPSQAKPAVIEAEYRQVP